MADTNATLAPQWATLAEIAQQLEQSDSLAELTHALLSASAAFPDQPGSAAGPGPRILGRFLRAVLAALSWERFAVDPDDRPGIRSALAQAAAEGAPIERSPHLGPLTIDERAALRLLWQPRKIAAA